MCLKLGQYGLPIAYIDSNFVVDLLFDGVFELYQLFVVFAFEERADVLQYRLIDALSAISRMFFKYINFKLKYEQFFRIRVMKIYAVYSSEISKYLWNFYRASVAF